MAQHYTDPSRESDPHALPDIETFMGEDYPSEEPEDALEADKWYWWSCLPGCLPDGEPNGPFDTENEALADARDGFEDDDEPIKCRSCGSITPNPHCEECRE